MCKVIVVLAALIPFGAAASTQRLSEAAILKLAKAHAANYCAHSTLGPYTKVGCEYSANFDGKNWGVIAHSVFRDSKGKPAVVQGADKIYVFGPSGELLQELDGE